MSHIHEWELSLDTEANLCYCGVVEPADLDDLTHQLELLKEMN